MAPIKLTRVTHRTLIVEVKAKGRAGKLLWESYLECHHRVRTPARIRLDAGQNAVAVACLDTRVFDPPIKLKCHDCAYLEKNPQARRADPVTA